MTATALTAPVPAAPKIWLALLALFVLVLHALLLLGLPHWWMHDVPVTGGPPVFQIRALAFVPPQVAPTETPTTVQPAPQIPLAPPPLKKPQSRTRPEPLHKAANRPPPPADIPPPQTATPVFSSAPSSQGDPDHPPSLLQAPPAVAFGGNAPLPPIAPLPSDQILAAQQQAARPNTTILTASNILMPGTPEPAPQVRLPQPVQAVYKATITSPEGRVVVLNSTFYWRHDGQYYDARWILYGPAIGDHSRYSLGLITARGIAPGNARGLGADAYDLTFDYVQGQLYTQPSAVTAQGAVPAQLPASITNPDQPSQPDQPSGTPLSPSVQDRLSVLIELSALMAGDPSHYPVDSRITLPVADSLGQTPPVTFEVVEDGDISLTLAGHDAGRYQALHLVHESSGAQDSRIDLWLGKQLDYLPVRLQIVPSGPGGERLDMTLGDIHLYPMPAATLVPPGGSGGSAHGVR
ncbi:MAG: DUF3108 domain-containing protein [Burkholderiaceae bacterium]|nr:DUF3108 domain-containing protein [Burkholderiaceae bacterium]